jgi:hypothetical protein
MIPEIILMITEGEMRIMEVGRIAEVGGVEGVEGVEI